MLTGLIMGIVSCGPTPAGLKKEHRVSKIWEKGSYEANLLGDVQEPFNPDELVELAKHPKSDSDGRLGRLILRAAAEKDARFCYLLEQENLREDPDLDLVLSAYDYSVNGRQKALEKILARHRKLAGSWDSETVWVLGYINEWNLTKKALGSQVLSGDGSGTDTAYAFWLTRRHFYPNNSTFPDSYQKFRQECMSCSKKPAKTVSVQAKITAPRRDHTPASRRW